VRRLWELNKSVLGDLFDSILIMLRLSYRIDIVKIWGDFCIKF
jgi:hypothetical protein